MVKNEILAQAARELPVGYKTLLKDLKQRIRGAQIKAALAANRELIQLYWDIGRILMRRQEKEGWGRAVVDRLSCDIRRELPDIKGFSARNMWRMRAFYLTWSREIPILSQLVTELDDQKLPEVTAEIPWGHNVVLVESINDPSERFWYAQQTIEHGWSRNILVMQIESDLYHRKGKAVTNFKQTLPPEQSDLASQTIKDPYIFDFLSMSDKVNERALEKSLVEHVRQFLIELGEGFAFVGQQYPLEVDDDDYYLDLLFYHYKLRCFVVIELKNGPFKPEYAGKMNFYLSAVDDLLTHKDDKPSIGLILCKDKKKITAEYAIRDIRKPIGVSQWKTKLVESLPKQLRGKLPSVKELERELS